MDNETRLVQLKTQELKAECFRLAAQTAGLRPTASLSDSEVVAAVGFPTVLDHAKQLHEWVTAK